MTSGERATLLGLARASVEAVVSGGAPPVPPPGGPPAVSGVFVTLRRGGTLRGCLGTLGPNLDLGADVVRCAAEAAAVDPRFPPVTAGELGELSIEISVLGPLEPIEPRADAFTVGRHGLVVEAGLRRGLLLPQVAVEWGWTPEAFLDAICVKAGLPADAWRGGVSLFRFTADVFGD